MNSWHLQMRRRGGCQWVPTGASGCRRVPVGASGCHWKAAVRPAAVSWQSAVRQLATAQYQFLKNNQFERKFILAKISTYYTLNFLVPVPVRLFQISIWTPAIRTLVILNLIDQTLQINEDTYYSRALKSRSGLRTTLSF